MIGHLGWVLPLVALCLSTDVGAGEELPPLFPAPTLQNADFKILPWSGHTGPVPPPFLAQAPPLCRP